MATLIAKTDAAAEALRAVVRLYESAERRHKEAIQDAIDALKTQGGRAIINEYRYVFRNEAERDGYGSALRSINERIKDGITLEAVQAALQDETDGLKYDLLRGVGGEQSTCPVKNAAHGVKAQGMLGVLDNLTRIKMELEAAAA